MRRRLCVIAILCIAAKARAMGNAAAATDQASGGGGSTNAQSACAGCFATLGIGTNLNATGPSDYSNTANIIQATHLGNGTPQLLVGVAYQVPWHGFFYHRIKVQVTGPDKPHCEPTQYNQDADGALIYCYPWRMFVNAKFSTDASQTFNGFTFGVSHRLAKNLDLLLGVSYTAFNEASPGFQNAAIQTVATQQAASNPSYSQFSLLAMKHNWHNAFDGFPTQLISNTGQPGALIYPGAPLSTHYHPGAFLGVAVPIGLKSLLGAK